MFGIINLKSKIFRQAYIYANKLPIIKDVSAVPGSKYDMALNNILRTDTQARYELLGLKQGDDAFAKAIHSWIDIIGITQYNCRVERVRFIHMPEEVTSLMIDQPIVKAIYTKAMARHELDPSGHDADHVREVFIKAIRFANKIGGVNVKRVAIAAACHDLGYTFEKIGRAKHGTKDAAILVGELLRKWNQEFLKEHPLEKVLTDEDIRIAELTISQHSLGDDLTKYENILKGIKDPIVRIVTLADKSAGGGIPGFCRSIQYNFSKGRSILKIFAEKLSLPSCETYVKTTLMRYFIYMKTWLEYQAVKETILGQTKDMSWFLGQLKMEAEIPKEVRKAIDTREIEKIENLIKKLQSNLGFDHVNELIHPQRVMVLTLQIAHKLAKKSEGRRDDYFILGATALLHNFWRPEHKLNGGNNNGIEAILKILEEESIEVEEAAGILNLIDSKQISLSSQDTKKSILDQMIFSKSVYVNQVVTKAKLLGRKENLQVEILRSAEIISKDYGAHGIVFNISKSTKDNASLTTTFYNFLMRMYDSLTEVRPLNLPEAREIATPLVAHNRKFVLAYLKDVMGIDNEEEALKALEVEVAGELRS